MRKLFEKEGFLQGNRQRWCIIFLVCAGPLLVLNATGHVKDVTPFLTFLTFLSGSFILGYSGSETMKLFRAGSQTENQNVDETQTISSDERIIQDYRQKYADDPSYPPDEH